MKVMQKLARLASNRNDQIVWLDETSALVVNQVHTGQESSLFEMKWRVSIS